jgi:hypothetical protein
MLLGVGGATAATPGWVSTASSVPGSVTPGNYALYIVNISNTGTSNISQLYLTSSVTGAAFSASPSAGTCQISPTLFCNLGALNSGKSDTIQVVYQTPASGTSYAIDFQFNSNGATFSDKKKTSHGDTLDTPITTTLDGTADFAGGYVVFGGTTFSTATGNVQSTTVHAPTTGIPVTVQESAGGTTSQCGGAATPVGQLVTLNVNGGATFASDFLTTLTIQTSSLPSELVLSQVSLCHKYDSGVATLLPACATDAAPADNSACFFAKWSGTSSAHDKDKNGDADDADDHLALVIDVFDNQNGGVRGQFG